MNAQSICLDLFKISTSEIQTRVENLNRLDLLEDVIVVYDSPLLTAIKNKSFVEAVKVVQKMKTQNRQQAFFDEINIAISLGANRIAIYLFEMSTFDYSRTPLRNDLLMSSAFFKNIQMINYFISQKKIKFSSPSLKKVLRWANSANQVDVALAIEAHEGLDNQH